MPKSFLDDMKITLPQRVAKHWVHATEDSNNWFWNSAYTIDDALRYTRGALWENGLCGIGGIFLGNGANSILIPIFSVIGLHIPPVVGGFLNGVNGSSFVDILKTNIYDWWRVKPNHDKEVDTPTSIQNPAAPGESTLLKTAFDSPYPPAETITMNGRAVCDCEEHQRRCNPELSAMGRWVDAGLEKAHWWAIKIAYAPKFALNLLPYFVFGGGGSLACYYMLSLFSVHGENYDKTYFNEHTDQAHGYADGMMAYSGYLTYKAAQAVGNATGISAAYNHSVGTLFEKSIPKFIDDKFGMAHDVVAHQFRRPGM